MSSIENKFLLTLSISLPWLLIPWPKIKNLVVSYVSFQKALFCLYIPQSEMQTHTHTETHNFCLYTNTSIPYIILPG